MSIESVWKCRFENSLLLLDCVQLDTEFSCLVNIDLRNGKGVETVKAAEVADNLK